MKLNRARPLARPFSGVCLKFMASGVWLSSSSPPNLGMSCNLSWRDRRLIVACRAILSHHRLIRWQIECIYYASGSRDVWFFNFIMTIIELIAHICRDILSAHVCWFSSACSCCSFESSLRFDMCDFANIDFRSKHFRELAIRAFAEFLLLTVFGSSGIESPLPSALRSRIVDKTEPKKVVSCWVEKSFMAKMV